ncbi:hypothetical protein GCM10008020_39860 [Massilia psychrophila]|nr:hypothetical protein GCM10008020_39860 [Massilia psychrophila]
MPRLRHALQRRDDALGTFKRGAIAQVAEVGSDGSDVLRGVENALDFRIGNEGGGGSRGSSVRVISLSGVVSVIAAKASPFCAIGAIRSLSAHPIIHA